MPEAASPIQRFVEEIHRRSMWQVLGVYLGSAWGVLEVLGELWRDAEPGLQPRVRAASATIEAILRARG